MADIAHYLKYENSEICRCNVMRATFLQTFTFAMQTHAVISQTKTQTLTIKSHDDWYKSLKSRKSNSNTFSSSVGNDFLIQFFLISLWIFCFTVCRVRHAMNRRVNSKICTNSSRLATPHPAGERMLTSDYTWSSFSSN